jgi:hypothetical protein
VRSILPAVIIFIGSVLVPNKATAAPAAGLTITPAMATISLASGQTEATTQITVRNTYQTPVTVAFKAALPRSTVRSLLSDQQLNGVLHIAPAAVTIEPQQTVTQVLTLQDNPALPPGSTSVVVRAEEQRASRGGIAILPSLEVPLVLLKQAGAVSKLALEQVSVAPFNMTLPNVMTARFRNQGNTIAIPRGTISIRDPHGTDMAAGVINGDSLALVTEASARLETKLTQTGRAVWPGRYTAHLSYRVSGSDMPFASESVSFWYVAWWQLVLVLGAGVGIYYAVRRGLPWLRTRRSPKVVLTPKPAKRHRLIGRDIT